MAFAFALLFDISRFLPEAADMVGGATSSTASSSTWCSPSSTCCRYRHSTADASRLACCPMRSPMAAN